MYQIQKAKSVCQRLCPLLQHCLLQADVFLIYGVKTFDEQMLMEQFVHHKTYHRSVSPLSLDSCRGYTAISWSWCIRILPNASACVIRQHEI